MKLSYVFLGVLLAVIAVLAAAGFRGQHSTRPPSSFSPT